MSKHHFDPTGMSSPVVDRIWSDMMVRLEETSFWNMRVLVVGCNMADRSMFRESLRHIGVRVVAIAPHATHLCAVADMGKSFTHIIVNLDAFGCMEDAVEALLKFRTLAPENIVIAVSSLVGGDDLGQERSAICDATLRLPVTERRLREGLSRGQANRFDAMRSEQPVSVS